MRKLLILLVILTLCFPACKKSKPIWILLKTGFNDHFHDIEPINMNTAIAYSYGTGLIIKTTDGGKNWKTIHETDSIYYEQIEFPEPGTGYICGNTNVILKTVNGGDDWFGITLDSIPGPVSIYGMKFIDPSTGYIANLYQTSAGFVSDIYLTSNGGFNWTRINSIPEMVLNIELIGNELWASGHNVVLKNIEKDWEVLYKDTTKEVGQIRDFAYQEGVLTMVSFNGYIIQKIGDRISKSRITQNRIRSIVALGNHRLIAAGDKNKEEGNMFESPDNGKTWHEIDLGVPDIHRLNCKDGILWGVGKQDALIMLK